MDRKQLAEAMKAGNTAYDRENIRGITRRSIESAPESIDGYGVRALVIALEELSELTKELTKELRGKGDRTGIIEELSHVYLSCGYIQEVLGITDKEVQQVQMLKMEQIEKGLEEEEYYR
jgi:hypothetical protein